MGNQRIAGIDVSSYQDDNGHMPIDWAKVRSGDVKFAVLKASQGAGAAHGDGFARRNQGPARAALEHVGYYHFFSAYQDPKVQAQNFLAKANPGPGEFACLDMEDHHFAGGAYLLRDRMKLWFEVVEQKMGKRAALYTSGNLVTQYGLGTEFHDHPLWLKYYPWINAAHEIAQHYDASTATGHPPIPPPWKSWMIWQFTEHGKVPGIVGTDVDLNWGQFPMP